MRGRLMVCVGLVAVVAAGCARAPKPRGPWAVPDPEARFAQLAPRPASLERLNGGPLSLGPGTIIGADAAAQPAAALIATLIRHVTGAKPPIADPSAATGPGAIVLTLTGDAETDAEGYELRVDAGGLRLTAATPAGLFYGVQTIRQLLPAAVEYEAILFQKPRPVLLPAVHIVDRPRYPWRGAMLDVARHFFSVDEVKRYIDLLALHKMNRLHLHLADDQGWRIEITSWPDLTLKGGRSEVGGGNGGYYTQAQYADLVAYAADRSITSVPEIDMPGHTNAALSSYAQLNCSGVAPEPYSGPEVRFSAFCVDRDVTYQFIDDVVREIAALTPGPYFHAGGDEVKTLTPEQYRAFVERVQTIVEKHGKRMVGWDEVAAARLLPTSIVQHWRPEASRALLAGAPHLILSPADRMYIDMKYDEDTILGLNWAGYVPIRPAYDWDPDARVPGAAPGAVLGIEAPLWSETVTNIHDVEYMAMPRLAALAEVGWTPQARRSWREFRVRLAAQAPRWTALGVNDSRDTEIYGR
jgi:hexosaminidase